MDGVFFTAEQLERVGVLDGEPGLTGWWVNDMGVSYRGRAVAPADWDAEQVAAGLNRLAQHLGENVLKGRLYSRTRVDQEG
jgi:hypothetical protein